MPIPAVSESYLRPYVSFVGLMSTEEEPTLTALNRQVRRYIDSSAHARVVADGLANPGRIERHAEHVDEQQALVFVVEREPSWARGSTFVERRHALVVMLRSARVIALCTDSEGLRENVLRAVDRHEMLDHQRVPSEVLQTALIRGDVHALWLGGAGRPRRDQPHRKTLYGTRDAQLDRGLDPIGDQAHTFAAARSSVTADLGLDTTADVGTGAERSTVWYKRSDNWTHFVKSADRLLVAIREVIATGETSDRFHVLAKKRGSLDGVSDAYDAAFREPQDLPGDPDDDGSLQDAYDLLAASVISTEPMTDADAQLTIGPGGAEAARVCVHPVMAGDRFEMELRVLASSDDQFVAQFRASYERVPIELFYNSNHSVSEDGVFERRFDDAPFENWRFDTFEDIDITTEKPSDGSQLEIGKLSADAPGRSLFGWVVRTFRDGWLYCDDGTDELADFVSLDPRGDVAVIHVKAAASLQGQVSTQVFEQVCSQVAKNMTSLSVRRLREDVGAKVEVGTAGPLWHDGDRSEDFEEFLRALDDRPSGSDFLAMIIQPHIARAVLDAARARNPQAGGAGTVARLRRLDHLLNSTHVAVARVSARLVVYGRQ